MKKVKRLQQGIALLWCGLAAFSAFACAPQEKLPDLPNYAAQDFVTFGYWSPYALTEESFARYKQSGLNTMMFTNHSIRPWTSDNLHYLGSNATKKSLELCRQVGLNALLNYGDWYRAAVEGSEFSETPFSDYDIYGEYKDIIVGVHIADEPSLGKIDEFANPTLINDYKSVYDVPYMLNLFPNYAAESVIGEKGYKNYVQTYADKIASQFEKNRLLSVDFYPFRANSFHPGWLACYNDIANVAKTTGSKKSYYIQTAAGNEFQKEIGAAEIAIQLNVAMAFGADWFGFFCYETPQSYDGLEYSDQYAYCMLNPDGTHSPLYYAVQSELARISAFSDAYLAYEWKKTVPLFKDGERSTAFRMLGSADFSGTAVKGVKATEETIVGCFEGEQGQAFMFVHYGDPETERNAAIDVEFSAGEYAAIYGVDKTPKVVKLQDGKLNLQLTTGKGCFVTLL